MSFGLDSLNELKTAPDPNLAEHVGHHGARFQSPLLATLLVILIVGAIITLLLVAG